jgi:hypothetical protein
MRLTLVSIAFALVAAGVACSRASTKPADAPPDTGGDAADAAAPDGDGEESGPCRLQMGEPVTLSEAGEHAWEVSIDVHRGVVVASWIARAATSPNGLVLHAAVRKPGGSFGKPFLVPIDQSYGDPTVRFASDGTLYIGSICHIATTLTPSDICLVYSTDDGATFSKTFTVSDAPADTQSLRDRPWLGATTDGRIVVTYLDADVDGKTLAVLGKFALRYKVATRTGAGADVAFSGAVEIDPGHTPVAGPYNGTYSAPPAFEPSTGRFHVAYETGDYLPLDGAWALRHARSTPDMSSMEAPHPLGPGGYPVAATAGPGRVGVLTYGAAGVSFFLSTDGGDTFAPAPTTLGDPTRLSQLPWLTGDPKTGDFHAAWLDRADATSPWVVHYQHLPAKGPMPPVTDVATGFTTDDTNERDLGDFIGIALDDDGTPSMAWSETRPGGGAVVRAATATCR